MIAGQLEIQLYADVARIKKDMDDARRIVGDTMGSLSSMAGLAKKALGAVGVALSIKEFAGLIKGSIDAAAGLHDLSIQTGASVASLMAFKTISATSETTIDGIGAAMNKMAKGMAVSNEESKGMGQAVQAIGVDFDKLKSMAPDQQMLTVAKALDRFQDGAGKSAVAMTLFGKEGAKMLPFLKDLADESGSVTAKLTEQEVKAKAAQAAMADDFGDNLIKIQKSAAHWKKDLAMGMLPALTDASEAFLNAANSANGLNARIKELSEDGSIERWTRNAIDGVTALGSAIIPAAKIWGAYYAAFVAAPAIFTAASTAIGRIQVQLALAKMEAASGVSVWKMLNTTLFGTSVSAEMASGALGKLKVVAGTLFAAFAGWELGTYLRDQFVEARIAGLAFVGATLTGWENVKYGAEMAWEGIKFAWNKTVGAMKESFADYLSGVAKGLSFVGASDTSKQVEAYAESLRKAAGSQQNFSEQTAGMTAAHVAALAAIDQNITDLVSYELAANNAAKGADGAAKSIKSVLNYDGNVDPAIKKEAEAYATLIAAIRAKTDENKLELAVGESVTEGQKLQIKMDQELASGKLKLSDAHKAAADAALVELGATEQDLKLQASQRDVTKYIAESTAARDKDSASLAVQYQMYGKSADARDLAMVAVQAEAWKEEELAKLRADKKPITDQIIAQLNAEAKARALVGEATLGQGKALQYAAQLHEENKKFGLEYIMDDKARAAASLAIDDQMWQERIRLAGEGTDAQKALQTEYTTWYQNQALKPQLDEQKKMWGSIEQTAHDTFVSIFDSGKSAFNRLRDTLKNGLLDLLYQMTLRKWIFQIGASVGMGGVTGLAQAAIGMPAAAGSGEVASAISLANAASSAYKALSGGFAGLSDMVAGGVQSAMSAAGYTPLASQGLATASGQALTPFASMAGTAASYGAGLLGGHYIGNAISGDYSVGNHGQAVVNVASVVGAVVGGPIGAAIGGAIGGLINRAFGHGSTETQSQGLRGTLSASSLMGESYQNQHQDGGWFTSDKNWTDTQTFTADLQKQFTEGFAAIKAASSGFATSIGVSTDALATYAKQFDIKLGTDAAANEKAITDFFTTLGDEMATKLVPNLDQFTKSGESASAALQRLAGDFSATNQVAQLIGKSGAAVFGSMGIDSAAARERLIDLAGGVQVLGQQAASYAANFLTDAEKLKPVQEAVGAAMASLGLASVQTRDQFKAVVDSLDLTSVAGAQQFTSMMALADAFAQVHPAIDATTEALTSANKGYQDQIDAILKSSMSATDVRAMEIKGMDASTVALYDRLHALQSEQTATQAAAEAAQKAQDAATAAAQKAQEAATAVIQKARDESAAAVNSLGAMLAESVKNASAAAQALLAFNDSLKLGNLSSLSKGAQYDVAKQEYLGADIEHRQAASSAFLQAAQARGGSKLDYARDFAMVLGNNSTAAAAAPGATAAAMAAVLAAFRDGQPTSLFDGSHANGLDYVPFNNYRANLHEGEGVLTAAENKRYRSSTGGGMTEATARELIAVLNRIDSNTGGTEKHARKQADILVRVTKDGKSLQTTAA